MAAKETKTTDNDPEEVVPVEQWLQHQDSDYVDWMDKDGPLRADELSDEQRAAYDAALAAREKKAE